VVLVVEQATAGLAEHLPVIAALVAAEGSPVSHLATLLREFAVPSIFQLGPSVRGLIPGAVVSVDATKRAVYQGSRWPDIKERVLLRLASRAQRVARDPLREAVLSLHLTDPFSRDFSIKNCRSVHDVIRFIHEMAVRSTFKFGDERNLFRRRAVREIKSKLPLRARLIDLDGSVADGKGLVAPEAIKSAPFQAFWAGLADPRLAWPDRWGRELSGLPADFQEMGLGGTRGTRRRGEANYMIAARDYFNFNARFAYHYAMVDALIGPGDQNNYVHFRFHNGGASNEQRERRARFLERVLRESRFGVDRRGDLLAAWLRRYSQSDSEAALTMLGRLMVCARQLDLLMKSDGDAKLYAERFLAGDYQAFN
jgi:pyruvate,water dikinase